MRGHQVTPHGVFFAFSFSSIDKPEDEISKTWVTAFFSVFDMPFSDHNSGAPLHLDLAGAILESDEGYALRPFFHSHLPSSI